MELEELFQRFKRAIKKRPREKFLFPNTHSFDMVLEMLRKDGYSATVFETEGTCVSFDCKQLSHVIFSELGKETRRAFSGNIGLITNFMLCHPEITDVSVEACSTRHKDKKNMAQLSILGHTFSELGGRECNCECGCELLPWKQQRFAHEGNSYDDTEAYFEFHRFPKAGKDRVVKFSKVEK